MVNREIIEHFSNRAQQYDQDTTWVRDESVLRATLEPVALCPRSRVLDAGAGTGAVLRAARSSCGDLDLCVALDASRNMLQRITNCSILRCVGDLGFLPFRDGCFNVALCRQVLHYIADLDRVMTELYRVLTEDGALIIGQIVPFGEDDEEHWTRILLVRQPLRKRFLNLHQLRSALARCGFAVVGISQLRVPESLNSWLRRYEATEVQTEAIRRLFLDAPPSFKTIRNVRPVKDDIAFENCWVFIRGVKNANQHNTHSRTTKLHSSG